MTLFPIAFPARFRLVAALLVGWMALACADEGSGSGAARAAADPAGADQVADAPVEDRRRMILFVGTSLTAGLGLPQDSAFPQLVHLKIQAEGLPFDVLNSGVSGETTAGLLRRLDWVLRAPFDVLVIETGANDGLRGIPVATVKENLEAIVERFREARPDAVIVLVQMEAMPNLGARYASEFRDIYKDVAERHGLILLPFLLDGVAGRAELNQPDGIHPNLAGERIVAENVWRGLRGILLEMGQEGVGR